MNRRALAVPTLPPVEEFRSGMWSLPVPIPDNPLHYVLLYVLELPDGLLMLDAGWDAPESWSAVERGLARVGGGVAMVKGVLVTHIHPDHYGLAGRIREVSGAWIGLHPADADLIADRYEDVDDLLERNGGWLREAGVPDADIGELRDASLEVLRFVRAARPDRLVEDGDLLRLPGWELRAIHTPGHTPGHLCFHEERTGTLFTGDHVLPRITPNVSKHPQSTADPLGDFIDSLERLRHFGDIVGCPAHEWRFDGLRTRLDSLIAHHGERLDEIEQRFLLGAETVWEVASVLSWSRGWDRVRGHMRRAALGETHAHIVRLERTGRVERRSADGECPIRWTARERQSAHL